MRDVVLFCRTHPRRAGSRFVSVFFVRAGLALCLSLVSLSVAGCDDRDRAAKGGGGAPPEKTGVEKPPAAPTGSADDAAKKATPAPTDKLPDITVDNLGVYLGGERVDLKAQDGAKKLKEVVAKHRFDAKSPVVVALRAARAPDVSATVNALGDAGASEVLVKTQDRARKDEQLRVVPEARAGKLADCTVTLAMLKDRTTASWPVRGATATKYPKGMAGPDLSLTLEGVTKMVNACPSTSMVFAGDDSVDWGLTFDMITRVSTASPALKITSYVLPRAAPVAGHAVKLGG